MNVAAKPITGSATDERVMMYGCIRTSHAVTSYPISFRDVHADALFGMKMFQKMGVEAGSMVLFTSGSSEYAQFWPYEISVANLEGCVAIAENFIFDAGRAEMFMRRLSIKVAFGITDAILDGMAAMNLDVAKAFQPAGSICARDGAADRLKELGFAPWRMVSFGPAFGFVSPDGETFHDQDQWLLEAVGGELLITSRHARALPVVRLPTGIAGSVDPSGRFSLA
ncbi:hypothetical protein J3E64_004078 [Sphingobium sp. OAS761]|uniref:hypothetical protein n=1 Tax=Sphingobium sp. OAS761 TaxID=2817901 RepID=UPI00209D54CA|nr:hypothetical protein [Sphingobium sp. OAS761]MCP1472360.1 hypothetical protein [Sphingobium sp. OAS761]